MNLTHLRYIVEVERYGSVTKAAQALYIGQPNLSKIIKDMESELGIEIFRRTARGVIPTDEGRQLLKHAKAALSQIDEIGRLSGKRAMRIMLPPGFPGERAAGLIKQGTAVISEAGTEAAIEAVSGGECDIAVIRFPAAREKLTKALLSDKGLKGRRLAEYELTVLVSADSPLADVPQADKKQLAELTEIVREGEPSEDGCMTVSAGVDIPGLLSSLPGTYFISPPLPEGQPERLGLRQIPLAGADRFAEFVIEKAQPS